MCRTDFFTVFARVSTFVNWIQQKTGGKNKSFTSFTLIIYTEIGNKQNDNFFNII